MKRLLIGILLLFLAVASYAQKATDATRLFDEGDYAGAAEINRKLLTTKPNNGVINFRLARCLIELGQPDEAVGYLQTAAENGFVKACRWLGDFYFDNYYFDEAVQNYGQWLDEGDMDETDRLHYADRLRQAQLGAQLLRRTEDIALIDSVVVPKNKFIEHIVLPHDAGRFLLFGDGLAGFEVGRQDRRYLTLEHDGQTDLYRSDNLMGEWSAPQPLSVTLNSERNENFPFVAADGITIYFGSEGHNGLGGYDIFMARYNSERNDYMPPQNVGMPFNSTANDYMMAFDEAAGIGWLVTDRHCTDDSVAIYRFEPNNQHIVLHDKTDDELRKAALLQGNRRANAPQKTIYAEKQRYDEVDIRRFVVNDTTVYTAGSDFRSAEARAEFGRLQTLRLQIAQAEFTLQAKRELWQITDNDAERAVVANDILSAEKAVQRLYKTVEACEKRIRQTENEMLKQPK